MFGSRNSLGLTSVYLAHTQRATVNPPQSLLLLLPLSAAALAAREGTAGVAFVTGTANAHAVKLMSSRYAQHTYTYIDG